MEQTEQTASHKETYPVLEIHLGRLEHNLREILGRCAASGIEVAGVVKGFTAHPEMVKLYETCGCRYIASSRIEQLARIRKAGIRTPLMLLRIPMLSELEETAALADISLQSEREVLAALNEAAGHVFDRQTSACKEESPVRNPGARGGNFRSGILPYQKRHRVILMADLGDLREGFWDRQELIDTALWMEHELPHLELAGIGTNLTCYGSVKATPEKMRSLLSLAAETEASLGRKLEYVCGGASSSLHMVMEHTMPAGINLLRLGESILLGHFAGCEMDFACRDVFTLKAEVIEVKDKPSFPVGELTADAFGRIQTYTDRGVRRRALAAIGRADCGDPSDLKPRMAGIEVIGASSDHMVLDVEAVKNQIRVGSILEFDLTYASMVYLTNTESVRIRYIR